MPVCVHGVEIVVRKVSNSRGGQDYVRCEPLCPHCEMDAADALFDAIDRLMHAGEKKAGADKSDD